MKITELELNKIYKPNNYEHTHNLYKLTDKGLEFKFEDDEWQKSILNYNELLTYEFAKYKWIIDWSKVPQFTPILCDVNGDGNWRNAYIYSFKKKIRAVGIFDLTDYEIYVSFKPKWTFQRNEVCYATRIKLPEDCVIQEEWYKED